MIKNYNDRHYECRLMVIRRLKASENCYWVGKFVVDYFVEDENEKIMELREFINVAEDDKIMELREFINTDEKGTVFIGYVKKIPTRKNYADDEVVTFIRERKRHFRKL